MRDLVRKKEIKLEYYKIKDIFTKNLKPKNFFKLKQLLSMRDFPDLSLMKDVENIKLNLGEFCLLNNVSSFNYF